MEDEEESSNSEDEPPSLWFTLLLIAVAIPLLLFYPLKTLLGVFFIYCTYIGYSEDKKRADYRRNRRKK
jgi:hypothetical protein